ncbi:hypothetical protein L9F63_003953, partial [Diploptera punctata]
NIIPIHILVLNFLIKVCSVYQLKLVSDNLFINSVLVFVFLPEVYAGILSAFNYTNQTKLMYKWSEPYCVKRFLTLELEAADGSSLNQHVIYLNRAIYKLLARFSAAFLSMEEWIRGCHHVKSPKNVLLIQAGNPPRSSILFSNLLVNTPFLTSSYITVLIIGQHRSLYNAVLFFRNILSFLIPIVYYLESFLLPTVYIAAKICYFFYMNLPMYLFCVPQVYSSFKNALSFFLKTEIQVYALLLFHMVT